MTAPTTTHAAQATATLAVLEAMVGRVQVTGDIAGDGPEETTATPRDPDGLAAENAWERQQEWFV